LLCRLADVATRETWGAAYKQIPSSDP